METKKRYRHLILPVLLCVTALALPLGEQIGTFELSSSPEVLRERPWTLFSYCLLHQTPLHLILALLLLFFVIRLSALSVSELWVLFASGVVAGGVAFLALFPLTGIESGSLVGSSAGICALVPITLYNAFRSKGSDRKHPFAWIMILVLLADFISFFVISSPGFLSHIGGYMVGTIALIIFYAKKRAEEERIKESQRAHSKALQSGIGALNAREWEIITNGSRI